jgi:hypothetical protein
MGHGRQYDDIDPHLWPEKDDFPEALYLEVGWGSRFLSNATGRAGDPPAGSLQIVGQRAVHDRAIYHRDALFSPGGYSRNSPLTTGLEEQALHPCNVQTRCQRPDDPPGPGHNHQHSMFYLAEGDYSLFNTCNSWISQALQAAGLPMKTALRARGVDAPG